jgi:hypothetical protein
LLLPCRILTRSFADLYLKSFSRIFPFIDKGCRNASPV